MFMRLQGTKKEVMVLDSGCLGHITGNNPCFQILRRRLAQLCPMEMETKDKDYDMAT